MPINGRLHHRLKAGHLNPSAPRPKYGTEIFAGTDYPQRWDGFIGQARAVEQMRTAVMSALIRRTRLDHTLLACGLYGIGKTTLAQIIANEMGVGFVQVSGPLTVDDARAVLTGMADKDILFWDELHLAVAGNRNRADWMLPFLTDHQLLTKHGAEVMPDVTVLGATTDAGKLPQTIISRFMVRPSLTAYTESEAEQIARNLADRMRVNVRSESAFRRIAVAANHNPRDMRMILTAIRDLAVLGPVDLNKAFEWAGVTYDGLTRECQDIMLVLLGSPKFTASIETIQASLGEPGPLKHHEQALIQKGYITISGRGRVLTDEGVERAKQLVQERDA